MSRSKEKSEVEHLRGLVRQLKSELRNLKKSMARKQKREHLLDDVEEREAELLLKETLEEKEVVSKKETCPKCRGKLDIIDGARIKIYICSDCSHRFTKRSG